MRVRRAWEEPARGARSHHSEPPVPFMNLPAGQLGQLTWPAEAEKVPTAHGSHEVLPDDIWM
jgi:hypothetical protein